MEVVVLTALGVGGATLLGAIIGFLFKDISHKFSDAVIAFASGVMLAASIFGLIVPSIEGGGKYALFVTISGIMAGALTLNLIDRLVPHLHKMAGVDLEEHKANQMGVDKVMLFVIAIAIHNLPEGIAAGVGFGGGDVSNAIFIAGGIAFQNIPEGMVIIAPMLASGITPRRTFIYAALTGFVEVVGTFIGYFAVSIATAILPFALAFAGGTMLYVISDEMIPETHEHGNERVATYALLIGFCFMLVFDKIIG